MIRKYTKITKCGVTVNKLLTAYFHARMFSIVVFWCWWYSYCRLTSRNTSQMINAILAHSVENKAIVDSILLPRCALSSTFWADNAFSVGKKTPSRRYAMRPIVSMLEEDRPSHGHMEHAQKNRYRSHMWFRRYMHCQWGRKPLPGDTRCGLS